jgi:predicted ABC-type ATPase
VAGGFCTIIGGPNGSGKSTIARALGPSGEFVNADREARRLNPVSPELASIAAGRFILLRLEALVSERQDFSYETTLSSHQSIALMSRCRRLGYKVSLVYVALEDADLNVLRVAQRVARGGHHIAEAIIRRRYVSSFARLPAAISLAHSAVLLDNSGPEPSLMLGIENERITTGSLVPSRALHRSVAAAAARALRTEPEFVFRAARYD